jgi:hemolysin activation/secretion protein
VRSGSRAIAGSVEYRAPLATLRRGFGFWPIFLDRTSVALFADAGTAWGVGGVSGARDWLTSAGAEVSIDAGMQYDIPYRLRLGVAAPITNRSPVRVAPASVYFQLGYAF